MSAVWSWHAQENLIAIAIDGNVTYRYTCIVSWNSCMWT